MIHSTIKGIVFFSVLYITQFRSLLVQWVENTVVEI